jgi:hypothetical protein
VQTLLVQASDVNAVVEKSPVLDAWRLEDRRGDLLFAWCPRCRDYHVHGGGRFLGDGDGPRVPHCVENHAGSYYVREIGLVTPAIRRDMRRKHPRGPEPVR